MSGSLIGALRVSLGLETAQFESGVKRAQGEAKRGAQGIGSAFSDIGKMTEGVIGVVGRMAVQFAVVAGAAKLADRLRLPAGRSTTFPALPQKRRSRFHKSQKPISV